MGCSAVYGRVWLCLLRFRARRIDWLACSLWGGEARLVGGEVVELLLLELLGRDRLRGGKSGERIVLGLG